MLVGARSLQNSGRTGALDTCGFKSLSLRQTFERSVLLRPLEVVFIGPIPIRTLAFGTNFRLANRGLSRLPLMAAALTFIALFCDVY